MATARMDVTAFVGKLLEEDDVDLLRALAMGGSSRREVSRIGKAREEDVRACRARPIEGEYPYLWLDATFHKIREGGRVVSVATVVAVGVSGAGHRSVLGVDTGP